ncbi:MAG TPA: TIGR02466 family protein [Steroidobacteraceae bacterium]|jgi:uncharacterized protein (TIGR02466 family)|nr:TIGR02466 family protein [Steroidobacteraceae bacterium]
MGTQQLFPTLVYTGRLRFRGWRALNARLLRECRQLRADDAAGRRWSARNYAGGYTSYGSAHRIQQLSPTFAALARRLDRHVARFTRTLQMDLSQRTLVMTDCWVNIMGRGAAHGLHLHPLATISGSYYVAAPTGAAGLKFEDPRLARFMAAPPRLSGARRANRPWVIFPVRAGALLLFESWLRHEVAPQARAAERVSISFNYSWF